MEELLSIVYKWRKNRLIVVIAAAIISAIAALLLPVKYGSYVEFLPINPYMMDRSNVFAYTKQGEPVYLFGGQAEMDRMRSLLNSSDLENYIIKKYNLFDRYEIDTTDKLKDYYMREELHESISLVETLQSTLKLSVLDKDPYMAAEIANEVANRLDTLYKELTNEKKLDLSRLYAQKIEDKRKDVQLITDSLNHSIQRNPKDTVVANMLNLRLKSAVGEYNKIQIIQDEHESALKQKFSSLYIIQKALPVLKKAYPVRWLIVTTAVLVTLIIMIFAVVVIEKTKEYKQIIQNK